MFQQLNDDRRGSRIKIQALPAIKYISLAPTFDNPVRISSKPIG